MTGVHSYIWKQNWKAEHNRSHGLVGHVMQWHWHIFVESKSFSVLLLLHSHRWLYLYTNVKQNRNIKINTGYLQRSFPNTQQQQRKPHQTLWSCRVWRLCELWHHTGSGIQSEGPPGTCKPDVWKRPCRTAPGNTHHALTRNWKKKGNRWQ